jgi:hypothetical protein
LLAAISNCGCRRLPWELDNSYVGRISTPWALAAK